MNKHFIEINEVIGDAVDYKLADDISSIEQILVDLKFARKRLEDSVALNCANLKCVHDYQRSRAMVIDILRAQERLSETLERMRAETGRLSELFTNQIEELFAAQINQIEENQQ